MKEKIILISLTTLAALVRLLLIFRDSVPFAYDMGRDLLWAKDISFYHTPTLIGPAASIWGVYFQPFWYYFLSTPLFFTKGNPLSAVYATAAMVLAAGFLAFILFKKYFPKIYIFALVILLFFSSNLINISTFAFHANLLPFLTLLTTYFIFAAITRNPLFFAPASLVTSLMFSADPAPAAVFTIVLFFFFFYCKIYKSPKAIISSAFLYIVPFIPQILFELRNNFVQTKSLLAYFSGNNPSLSGQLPLLERIPNRLFIYFDFVRSGFAPEEPLAITLLMVLIFGLYKFVRTSKSKNLSTLFKVNLYIFIIAFLANTFLVNVEIKNWYLYGITVNFAFLIIFALLGIKSKIFTFLFLTVFLLGNLLPFSSNEKIVLAKKDPATLSNQTQALDLIYKDKSEPFSVYIYTPSIYDLNYQYLLWWKGVKEGSGLPSDFAYLPNQPDYVRNKSKYFHLGPQPKEVYLIIENATENEFYTSSQWLTNFAAYKIVWGKNINGGISVLKMIE